MKNLEIDLYEYYKVKKPQGAKAILHCSLFDNNPEVDINRKNPAMLVLPGGGYYFCSLREAEPVSLKYCALGFQSFWLDYSVAPIRYPYQLLEATMAISYIRENAKLFNIDKNKVSAVGFSAGAHLCSLLGSLFDDKEIKELFNSKEKIRPDGIILSYPVITSGEKGHIGSFENLCGDNLELRKKLDITNCVSPSSSPAFIWGTYNDGVVPVKNSLLVADAYEKNNVKFSLHIWGIGGHGLATADMTDFENKEDLNYFTKSISNWINLSVEWLNELGLYID